MKALIIDFEATDKEPKNARMLEVGAMLYDSDTDTVLEELSELVLPEGFIISREIEELTGITSLMCKESGKHISQVIFSIYKIAQKADVFMAHNVSYDKTLYETECLRLGVDPVCKPWICSIEDIEYPERMRCRKLSHLVLDHKCAVDPSKLHRALGDCGLILQLIRAGKYKLSDIWEQHNIPWVIVQACVSYDQNQLAKDRGYTWQRVRGSDTQYPKSWVKRIKLNKLEDERKEANFRIVKL